MKQFLVRHDVRCRLIRDSAGRPSWTHTLSVPVLIAFSVRFLLGGFTFTIAGHGWTVPAWSAGEYAIACGVWLAMWAQRDFVEKKSLSAGNGGGSGTSSLPNPK